MPTDRFNFQIFYMSQVIFNELLVRHVYHLCIQRDAKPVPRRDRNFLVVYLVHWQAVNMFLNTALHCLLYFSTDHF